MLTKCKAILLRVYGMKSWTPWIVSLIVDAASKFLSYYATEQTFKNGRSVRGSVVKGEIGRRLGLLFYYLFKSPAFDNVVSPCIKYVHDKLAKIPIISTILGTLFQCSFHIFIVNFIEYLLALQRYYFYTESS